MEIKENVDNSQYSTFRIGGKFKYFVEINSIEELNLVYAIAKKKLEYRNLPILIVGGGSNSIFSNEILNVLALHIKILGFQVLNEDDEFIEIKVGAGENFDDLIFKTVELGLAGLESLSAIPGTVGATPVQNVGAYGVEVADVVVSLEVFDLTDGKIKTLSNTDCQFGYRDSIFKNEAKGKYIITGVVFKLKKIKNNQDLIKKRNEIINTRWSKLPKPNEIPNVGSFFKNPIVSNEIAKKILQEYPEAKFYPTNENQTKIPAGWLIEQAGLKGKSFGNISVYDKNALILINNGKATKDELIKTKDKIIEIVKNKFNITLELEPEIL